MTKKHGRAEIRFKLEHDLYDAAEEAFREAGLSIETGLTLFRRLKPGWSLRQPLSRNRSLRRSP